MNKVLTIENKKLLPIREAVTHVSYSKDYITRLAREGKIAARWIGRQWFVELSSLQSYEESARIEQELRKQKLSAERKREHELRAALAEQHVQRDSQSNSFYQVADALLVSGGVMVVGVMLAVVVSTAGLLEIPEQTAAVATTRAESTGDVASRPVEAIVPHFTLPKTTIATNTNAIVLVPEGDTASMATVTEYFSDAVHSRVQPDGTFVLVASDASGAEAALPYIAVPFSASTTTVGSSYIPYE